MKYIDAEKLVAKIKELNLVTKTYDEQVAFNNALAMVVEIITSLQEEQPEVKLEEEIASFFSKNPIPYEHITDWPLLKNTALYFFNLGLNARKV